MKNILDKFKINIFTYILFLMAFLCGYFKNIFIIFIIVLFHELGHIVGFLIFKINILKVVIYPFGGYCYVDNRIHERLYKNIILSMLGLIFQIILFYIFLFIYSNGYINSYSYQLFCNYNKYIFIFNLLPIMPLDGSKLLFSIFKNIFNYKLSYILYTLFSFIFLIIFIIYSYINNLSDLSIIMFLIYKFIEFIREYKYSISKFYLERINNDHYYNKIIYLDKLNNMKINKYYYINNVDEKTYLRNWLIYRF